MDPAGLERKTAKIKRVRRVYHLLIGVLFALMVFALAAPQAWLERLNILILLLVVFPIGGIVTLVLFWTRQVEAELRQSEDEPGEE